MNKKVENILVIVLFAIFLAVPVFTTHLSGGEVSQKEKRTLARIPSMENLIFRIGNRAFMKDVENWLNDHIGQRDVCRKIYAQVMNRCLHLSTSESVLFGRNSYYYFTRDNNIDIAKGTYPLDDIQLKKIAQQQKCVVDYYNKNKVRYILLLTPSKVSIYPEYLPFVKARGITEPAEIVQRALRKNGEVLNVKKALKAKKNTGKLFYLTDSHWNTRGSYVAYTEILKKIDKTQKPIPQKYKTHKRTGDLFSLLGLEDTRYKEKVDGFSFKWHSRQLKDNEIDKKLLDKVTAAFKQQKTAYIKPEIFINNSIKDGTIVIYGDSMMAGYLNMPKYLCEHFHKVIVLRLRKITPEVDEMIKPDVVIYSTTERFVKNVLTQFAPI